MNYKKNYLRSVDSSFYLNNPIDVKVYGLNDKVCIKRYLLMYFLWFSTTENSVFSTSLKTCDSKRNICMI